MPRRPDLPCSRCGKLGYRTKGSRLDGGYTCRKCRRIAPTPYNTEHVLRRLLVCEECTVEFRGYRARFCSIRCASRSNGRARTLHSEPNAKSLHSRRRSAAPGLTSTQRKRLLRTWRQRGVRCSYCDDLAATIDHVTPLIRGGTNYEGNLAPACRRCNSSKGALLLMEWRTGRRCTPTMYVLPSPNPKRIAKPKTQLVPTPCGYCAATFMPSSSRNRYCSRSCAADANRRAAYERYWNRDLGAVTRASVAWRAFAAS